MQVWQALLLVQTYLTQGQEHLTTSPESTSAVVSVVANFLDWVPHVHAKCPLSPGVVQRRVLSILSKLWSVMKNVFSESWLSSAVGSLLKSLVHHTFDLSQEDVKLAWSQLCASLISNNIPDLVCRLVAESEEDRATDVQRELWLLSAESWTSWSPTPSWTESVEFLTIPLRYVMWL